MARGKPSSELKCCTCNGQAAKCKGCRCAREMRPCINCSAPGCCNKVGSDSQHINRVIRNSMTIEPSPQQSDITIEVSKETIMQEMYVNVIQWRPDAFSLPKCSASNLFIDMLAEFYHAAINIALPDKNVLKVAIVFVRCVLQQIPSRKIKAIRQTLERRLQLWKNGSFLELFQEASILQTRSKITKNTSTSMDWKRRYCRLVSSGKINAASSVLEESDCTATLRPDHIIDGLTVKELLINLHPPATQPQSPLLLNHLFPGAKKHHPTQFLDIEADDIIRSSKRTTGGAGPSGLDALTWRRMLNSFGHHSRGLADALAKFAIHIATTKVSPDTLEAFVACRLVAIPKKAHGIRPIGVADVSRRIICKTILNHIKSDMQDVADVFQLCASQHSGVEFAIHSLRGEYMNNHDFGLLAVDASNAFNRINRKVAIHNMRYVCPALACVFENIYSVDAQLVLGGDSLYSEEGVTQGDPLAMAVFAMASLPLIRKIQDECPGIIQRWFADDANFVGQPHDLKRAWNIIETFGPGIGYFVNPSKTCLLLHHKQRDVEQMFHGIKIEYDGIGILGSFIGTTSYIKHETHKKLEMWTHSIGRISEVCESDPHIGFIGLSKSLQWKWTHFLRTINCHEDMLAPLRESLLFRIFPVLTKHQISDSMSVVLSSPLRLGGIGIMDPVFTSHIEHDSSLAMVKSYTSGSRGAALREQQTSIKLLITTQKRRVFTDRIASVKTTLSNTEQKALVFATTCGASAWLSTCPTQTENFILSQNQFRDGLATRYGWIPEGLPSICVCNASSSLSHLLSCKHGGLPIIRHNEIRDIIACELTTVCHGVATEPCLQRVDDHVIFSKHTTTRDAEARLDIVCSGLFENRFERTFLDVVVFNPHAASCSQDDKAAFSYHESRKNAKYEERVTCIERGIFVPLAFSCSGGIGPTALHIIKRIAWLQATRREGSSYAECVGRLKRKISVVLCRAASECIRGYRSARNRPYARGTNEYQLSGNNFPYTLKAMERQGVA